MHSNVQMYEPGDPGHWSAGTRITMKAFGSGQHAFMCPQTHLMASLMA